MRTIFLIVGMILIVAGITDLVTLVFQNPFISIWAAIFKLACGAALVVMSQAPKEK